MHFAATATATATQRQRQQLQQRQPSLSSACVCLCVCAILRRMSSIRSVDKLANDRSIARPIQLQFWPRGSFSAAAAACALKPPLRACLIWWQWPICAARPPRPQLARPLSDVERERERGQWRVAGGGARRRRGVAQLLIVA